PLGPHVDRVAHEDRIDTGRDQLLLAEEGDRLHAVADIAPQLVERAGAGETAGHADDGDALGRMGLCRFAHLGDLPFAPFARASRSWRSESWRERARSRACSACGASAGATSSTGGASESFRARASIVVWRNSSRMGRSVPSASLRRPWSLTISSELPPDS